MDADTPAASRARGRAGDNTPPPNERGPVMRVSGRKLPRALALAKRLSPARCGPLSKGGVGRLCGREERRPGGSRPVRSAAKADVSGLAMAALKQTADVRYERV